MASFFPHFVSFGIAYAEVVGSRLRRSRLRATVKEANRIFESPLNRARRQQAKSWELRTSTSLARLWQGQGKKPGCRRVARPVYGWFTDFDTKDFRQAKAFLAESR
jgi:hypothetical protein